MVSMINLFVIFPAFINMFTVHCSAIKSKLCLISPTLNKNIGKSKN